MRTKAEILTELQEALQLGIIAEADLQPFIHSSTTTTVVPTSPAKHPNNISAVDVMFYVAGIIFYAAIVSFISQSWDQGGALMHMVLSLGSGLVLWTIAYKLIREEQQSDVRKGLINALLLTGSLCVVTGGYVVTNELISGFGDINFIPGAIMLAAVGALHIGFDRLIKRDLTLGMGILLSVASFPSLLFGILKDADVSPDVWAVVLIASAALLAYTTRVISKVTPDREEIKRSFDSFAAFIALASMFSQTFGENEMIWYGVLLASVFGFFYLSILSQDKKLLGNASIFLVITVISIAFRYFSGFGISTSLLVATIGLLGSAAVAASINKKYFSSPGDTAQ